MTKHDRMKSLLGLVGRPVFQMREGVIFSAYQAENCHTQEHAIPHLSVHKGVSYAPAGTFEEAAHLKYAALGSPSSVVESSSTRGSG